MFDQLHLPAETPRLVEDAPRENRRMIEVTLNGLAHHYFPTPPAERRVAALAEVRHVRHEQHAEFIRPIIKQRVVNLDVDAQEVESKLLRRLDVVLQHLHVT